MTAPTTNDWWLREKQRRLMRVLLFLLFMLMLIFYFYYVNQQGRTGIVSGINFDTTNYVAFVRQEADGNTKLFAISADGSSLQQLTNGADHSNKATPVWTADGKAIIYASNFKDERITQLYILGNGDPRQLTYGSGNKFSPSVSSNGKYVAFLSQGAVKTATVTGDNVVQVLPPPRAGNEGNGDASITGNIDPEGPFEAVSFGSDGDSLAGIQEIANMVGSNGQPTQVDKLASVLLPGQPHVTVLDVGNEVFLSWEPNGARIACSFTGLETEISPGKKTTLSGINLWSIKEGKGIPQNLFRVVGAGLEPRNLAWSSNGSKIAFESWLVKGENNKEVAGIAVLDVAQILNQAKTGVQIDSSQVAQMEYLIPASSAGKPSQPKWSPDGGRIVYEMTRADGKRDLWIINSDGTNPINLTKGVGDNFNPCWSTAKPK